MGNGEHTDRARWQIQDGSQLQGRVVVDTRQGRVLSSEKLAGQDRARWHTENKARWQIQDRAGWQT